MLARASEQRPRVQPLYPKDRTGKQEIETKT